MWTDEMFGVKKPIIAMLHLRALPGDPLYEDGTGIDAVAEQAREELLALQEGGVDGILIAAVGHPIDTVVASAAIEHAYLLAVFMPVEMVVNSQREEHLVGLFVQSEGSE